MIYVPACRDINAFKVRELFSYDPSTGKLIALGGDAYVMGTVRGPTSSYLSVFFDGSIWMAHRIAYAHYHGHVDPSLVIDHLSRNKHDNRIDNLEMVTNEENLLRAKNNPIPEALKNEELAHREVFLALQRDHETTAGELTDMLHPRHIPSLDRISSVKYYRKKALACLDFIHAKECLGGFKIKRTA